MNQTPEHRRVSGCQGLTGSEHSSLILIDISDISGHFIDGAKTSETWTRDHDNYRSKQNVTFIQTKYIVSYKSYVVDTLIVQNRSRLFKVPCWESMNVSMLLTITPQSCH